ncbi:MAG: hypothetical protein EXS31_10420 [Pedosphaera sp.]|nr:hypothetical protein [Pedosphaera sp.]
MQWLLALLISAAGLVSGFCADAVPDFLLRNVNAKSSRPEARVSPRDYLLQVSAYYFGSSG